MRIRNKV